MHNKPRMPIARATVAFGVRRWLSHDLDRTARGPDEDHDRMSAELQRVAAELAALRAEAARDRFWTHAGVEATLIALGLAWLVFPRQSVLGQYEGLVVFAVAVVGLALTVARRFTPRLRFRCVAVRPRPSLPGSRRSA